MNRKAKRAQEAREKKSRILEIARGNGPEIKLSPERKERFIELYRKMRDKRVAYLQGELAKTTDPKVQAKIEKQIAETDQDLQWLIEDIQKES